MKKYSPSVWILNLAYKSYGRDHLVIITRHLISPKTLFTNYINWAIYPVVINVR